VGEDGLAGPREMFRAPGVNRRGGAFHGSNQLAGQRVPNTKAGRVSPAGFLLLDSGSANYRMIIIRTVFEFDGASALRK
jgi:hypothetical protein